MKKRILTGILAGTMTVALVLPVSAEETQKSESTTIQADIASTYTLTIPANTTITEKSTSTALDGALSVTGNVKVNQTVTVTANAEALECKDQGTKLDYTLKNGENVFTSAAWSEDELRDGLNGTKKEIDLTVDITAEEWEAAEAGTYTGTITFTAELQ